LLGMVVLFGAFLAALSTVTDRDAGVLRMLLVAPVPRGAIALGKVLGATLLGTVQALAVALILLPAARLSVTPGGAVLALAAVVPRAAFPGERRSAPNTPAPAWKIRITTSAAMTAISRYAVAFSGALAGTFMTTGTPRASSHSVYTSPSSTSRPNWGTRSSAARSQDGVLA